MKGMRQHWRNKLTIGCWLALTGIMATSAQAMTFDEHVITTEMTLTQGVISANVLPHPGNELITVGVDDKQQRWLLIYGFVDNKLSRLDKALIDRSFIQYDVFEPDDPLPNNPLQNLFFTSKDMLYQYVTPYRDAAVTTPPVKNEHQHWLEVAPISSLVMTEKPDYIAKGDFVRDINGDGLGDVIISDFNQTHLLLAQADGSWHQQSIGLLPIVEVTQSGAEYSRSEIFYSDMNFDQRLDLIKVGEGMLEVYYQKEDGTFADVAGFVSVSQPISGVNWWNKRDAYGKPLDQSDLLYRKVEHIKDINGDGFTDLVVRYTKSSGVFDRSNDYEVYLGTQPNSESLSNTVQFSRNPSSLIRAEGTLTGLKFADLDNDNIEEVIVSGFDIGVTQVIGALLSGSIDQDVYIFKMDTNSQFPSEANESKQVQLNFSLTSGQSGQPVVMVADINGDGLDELLLSDSDAAIKIYTGQKGAVPFSRKSQSLNVDVPTEGSMLSVADINGDGKDDLYLQYGPQDDDKLQQQLRVLIAK
ncbi:FG-GAP repeat domain-containing protein [Shewanella intestini]|uniref:VCBS repeat-containing protein n=1 Tax=Shewanella intestini TaxID=2017544 RepID=A0ABS5I3L1_9GAMM|nr:MULTISPECIES: VCBS repeat-containing protein [Shewanella]MBR9728403.1 VCBS repeat-containing protein [Shewanella intestini]MRG36745.1 VCBS repeat-containing protein [Shewanella sp. XMDDZSB0408]